MKSNDIRNQMAENQASNDRGGSSANTATRGRKNRTPISCDRCKGRKTKCVNPVPGPCEYCSQISAPCGVRRGPRQRPYYHVTEEEYRVSMQILKHLLPSRDLTFENLKCIAKDLENGKSTSASTNVHDATEGMESHMGLDDGSEEVGDLHDQLGCLMEDSLGEYRYVGACSEIAFNDAVCSMKGPSSPEKIIVPPRKCAFPPEKPAKEYLLKEFAGSGQVYLPPRDQCEYYVAKFFEQVHCVYWFYPAEQFHSMLDDTYMDGGVSSSGSWLCSLYSIFALGAASVCSNISHIEAFATEQMQLKADQKTPHDYLTLAKALVPRIHEEADVESIRGLAILSIAFQTFGFRIMSYLYIGTSIRIAFSLGFQHDKSPTLQSPVKREQNRRIWYTLVILDQEIASRCGSPCVCDERILTIHTSLPSEQILNPGTNTPLGILGLQTSLFRLRREIIQMIYREQSSGSRNVSFSRVTDFVSSLQKWQESVPSHLKWGVPVAPTHRRAIAILHLNYWNAMLLLTQPFLLYSVLRGSKLGQTKQNWFDKLGKISIDAAQSAMVIFKQMSIDGTFSSLVTFDSTCLLKVIMIKILALFRTSSQQFQSDIEVCFSLLKSMEQVGFCKTVVQELPSRFEELGIMQNLCGSESMNEASNITAEPEFWPPVDQDFANSMENLQSLDADFSNSFWMNLDASFSHIPLMSESFQPELDFLGGLPGSYT